MSSSLIPSCKHMMLVRRTCNTFWSCITQCNRSSKTLDMLAHFLTRLCHSAPDIENENSYLAMLTRFWKPLLLPVDCLRNIDGELHSRIFLVPYKRKLATQIKGSCPNKYVLSSPTEK